MQSRHWVCLFTNGGHAVTHPLLVVTLFGGIVLRYLFGTVFLFSTSPAFAGPCDAYVNQASTASGSGLVSAFKRTYSCDKAVAEENFGKFIGRAASTNDVDTIVSLH